MIRRRCFSFSMELIRNEWSSYEFFFFRGKERSNFREEVSIIKFSENFQFSKFEKGTKLLEASISQSSKYLNPAKFNFTQLSILLRNKIEITSEKRRRRNFPFQVILLQQSFLFLFWEPSWRQSIVKGTVISPVSILHTLFPPPSKRDKEELPFFSHIGQPVAKLKIPSGLSSFSSARSRLFINRRESFDTVPLLSLFLSLFFSSLLLVCTVVAIKRGQSH